MENTTVKTVAAPAAASVAAPAAAKPAAPAAAPAAPAAPAAKPAAATVKPSEKKVAPGAETPASLRNSQEEESDEKMVKIETADDVWKFAIKQGKLAGEGETALASLAIELVRATVKGLLDTEQYKHPCKNAPNKKKMTDDAGKAYDNYYTNFAKKSEAFSAGGWNANASKLRNFTQIGELDKINPVKLMSDARNTYITLNGGIAGKDKVKESKTLYPFYCDVAKAQLKQPTVQLTKDDLDRLVRKPVLNKKDLHEKLTAIAKTLDGIINPKAEDAIGDDSPKLKSALKAINDRIAELATLKEAGKAGVKPVPATLIKGKRK